MTRLVCKAGFTKKHLLDLLNVMRKFKNMLHLSNLLCYNGRSIDQDFVLSREQEVITGHCFLKEKSRAKDFVLWERALRSLAGRRDAWPT